MVAHMVPPEGSVAHLPCAGVVWPSSSPMGTSYCVPPMGSSSKSPSLNCRVSPFNCLGPRASIAYFALLATGAGFKGRLREFVRSCRPVPPLNFSSSVSCVVGGPLRGRCGARWHLSLLLLMSLVQGHAPTFPLPLWGTPMAPSRDRRESVQGHSHGPCWTNALRPRSLCTSCLGRSLVLRRARVRPPLLNTHSGLRALVVHELRSCAEALGFAWTPGWDPNTAARTPRDLLVTPMIT